MKIIKLEICCYDLESALMAQQAGADRIELCASPDCGGLTPSHATIEFVKKYLHIPIHVMIRPRAGDFNYNIIEFQVMKRDIEICKQLGADGVVFGILNSAKEIDKLACKQLADSAYPMHLTFHRAIDVTAHPYQSIIDLIEIGFNSILTSGSKLTAIEGIHQINKMMDIAKHAIEIIPASGITLYNMKEILLTTNCRAIHSSAKKMLPNIDFDLFSLPKQTVDSEIIKRMKEICKEIESV